MSHGDSIQRLPNGFTISATTENTPVAAAAHRNKRLIGVQFHPEVAHTRNGQKNIKKFFIRRLRMRAFLDDEIICQGCC